MPGLVPESASPTASNKAIDAMELALDSLLEFTRAACGWIGVIDGASGLALSVRRGATPDAWLENQLGRESIWGFGLGGGPALLNDLPPWPGLGASGLKNLLVCPLPGLGEGRGHVVLANKLAGFTSHDAAVAQGVAHFIGKLAGAAQRPDRKDEPLAAVPTGVLDLTRDGIVVLDARGVLVFANATWAEWTGFPVETLLHQSAPFSFWVGLQHLAPVGGAAVASRSSETEARFLAANALPFRRADGSLFWCEVESRRLEWNGTAWTVACLRRASPPDAPPSSPSESSSLSALAAVIECLPFAAVLTDQRGRTLASNGAAQKFGLAERPIFHDNLALASAAALEQLMHDPATAERRAGRLGLRALFDSSARGWMADWLAIPGGAALAEGGFLFALTQEGESLFAPQQRAGEWLGGTPRPSADWLPILLRPGQQAEWWDERLAKLTGLRPADLTGIPTETALDWLFPLQPDRNFVADLFHQTVKRNRGTHATLHVLSPAGSQPLSCTFFHVRTATPDSTPSASAIKDFGEAWLLLIGEPSAPLAADLQAPSAPFVRRFARGLAHLLNHYWATPLGVAETALDRDDLSPAVTSWFAQILEGCRPVASLVSALQDLAADNVGNSVVQSVAALVQELLDERAGERQRDYELTSDLCSLDVKVRVNRRMLRVVLRHLLVNAEDALLARPQRRIAVRARTCDEGVCCEIEDTGEGLATPDWTEALAPFYSTKGPFARDAGHAVLPATGLGLTVCQHLLALHGGRLELKSRPGEGTTAVVILPCATATTSSETTEAVRVDPASTARGPHAVPGLPSAVDNG